MQIFVNEIWKNCKNIQSATGVIRFVLFLFPRSIKKGINYSRHFLRIEIQLQEMNYAGRLRMGLIQYATVINI